MKFSMNNQKSEQKKKINKNENSDENSVREKNSRNFLLIYEHTKN